MEHTLNYCPEWWHLSETEKNMAFYRGTHAEGAEGRKTWLLGFKDLGRTLCGTFEISDHHNCCAPCAHVPGATHASVQHPQHMQAEHTCVACTPRPPPIFKYIFFFLFFPEIFSFKYSLKVALSSPTKPSLWQQAAICSVPKLQGCSMPRVNFATISCEDFLPSSDKMLMSKNVELERA